MSSGQTAICTTLAAPVNGQVAVTGRIIGSSAVYSCNVGFFLTGGSRVRVCQSNGQWSGSMPRCFSKHFSIHTIPMIKLLQEVDQSLQGYFHQYLFHLFLDHFHQEYYLFLQDLFHLEYFHQYLFLQFHLVQDHFHQEYYLFLQDLFHLEYFHQYLFLQFHLVQDHFHQDYFRLDQSHPLYQDFLHVYHQILL